MKTIIMKGNKTYDLSELRIKTLEFNVSSPNPIHHFENIEGRHGVIDQGTVFDAKPIDCSFYMKAVDAIDLILLRNEVFKLLMSSESFYIIDSREPGKRYLVKTDGAFSIDQTARHGFFNVRFLSLKGFAESVGRTLDDFTLDSDLWQVGQGLLVEEEEIKYIHDTNYFRIYNAGDIEIDPRIHDLTIKVKGETSFLAINNLTTGDMWQAWFSTTPNQTITLSGLKTDVGYMSMFSETNMELIRLAPGWNEFQISGAYEGFEIQFDFRFLYK